MTDMPPTPARSAHLNLTDGPELRLWLGDKFRQSLEILFYARTLSFSTGTPPEYEDDAKEFLKSHLLRFPKLTHLTIHGGPISLGQFGTPFEFAFTLQVLDLRYCTMSFRGLVAFLNQFPFLAKLILNGTTGVADEVNGEPEPKLSFYLKNLSISNTDLGGEVIDKFSKLKLRCRELSLDITQNQTAAQKFIHVSRQSLKSLDLMNTVGCYSEPLTLSACKKLHTVKMDVGDMRDTHLGVISSIVSPNLQKIVFSSAKLSEQGWAGVDDVLSRLVTNDQVEVIVEVKEIDHSGDDREAIFKAFLPNFRRVGRVVLMEGRGKEKEGVVIHDSQPVIVKTDAGSATPRVDQTPGGDSGLGL